MSRAKTFFNECITLSLIPFLSFIRCKIKLFFCVISVNDKPEVAADDASNPTNQRGSTEDTTVTKAPPPPDIKTPFSMDSPSRRATRSRIKLAANFSFTAGL